MPVDQMIKIAIADDHQIFRDGIKMALSGKSNLKMLWEAEDGKELMHKIAIKMANDRDVFFIIVYFLFC